MALLGIGGLVGGIAGKLIGKAAKFVTKKVTGAISRPKPGVGITTVPVMSGRLPSAAKAVAKIAAGGAAFEAGGRFAGRLLGSGESRPRGRRMQVTNMRALDRAIRRISGFEKRARKVMTFTTGAKCGKGKIKRRRQACR